MNVISLQVFFGFLMLVLFAYVLHSAQSNLTEAIASGVGEVLSSDTPTNVETISERLEIIRTQELTKLFLVAIGITGLFGVIVSYLTLTPTRNALEAQKRFIGNIAHELRTPLSVIKTNLEVLLLEGVENKEQRQNIQESISELDRSSDIINNLVSFNNLMQPEYTRFTEVPLDEVVDKALRRTRELAQNAGIHIAIEKTGADRGVWGNATALEQVVINLLRNAINHTKEGGRITVSIAPDDGDYLALSIRDTGSGIARADLLHIFEPFYRAERSRTRHSSGSGLGLTIVNEIVKAHHGKISVRSAPKRGTLITVYFPRGRYAKEKGGAVRSAQRSGSRNELDLDFTADA